MKKLWEVCLTALLALTLTAALTACGKKETTASDLQSIQQKGTLIVGITDYEPMDYRGEDGEWTGFDAEFARAVAAELGVEAQFVEIEWDNKFYELESGAIDCIWNGMTITDEALANASVSDAYVVNAQVVVMEKARLEQYPDTASLAGLTFAVEAGSAGEAALQEAGLDTYTAVSTQADALMEVASGSADACVLDITMAQAMTGEGTSYALLDYQLKMTSEEYGISFRKGSDLTAKVNDLMAQMRQDGRLQSLAEKYGLTLAD